MRRPIRLTVSLLALSLGLGLLLTAAAPAWAAKSKQKHQDKDQPISLTADRVVQDRDLSTVTATGHVELDQAGRILLADNISYNLKQDVIIATGNISLTEADGEVTFADYMELTGDMKDAAARGLRTRMIDDATLTARQGRRVGAERTVLNDGTYTACRPCAEHPEKPPLWQVDAETITHDTDRHLIEYQNTWFKFDDMPIFYTPYLSHADPTVKRESGILPPSVITNNVLGTSVRMPYFQVVDPNEDITLTPMLTSKQGEQLDVVDRERTIDGESKINFSVANMSAGGVTGTEPTGWHINALGQYDLDSTWRVGYQLQRASDIYYLQDFNYRVTDPFLTSRGYLEGFGYRSYAALEAYSFQNLTDTNSYAYLSPLTRNEPLALPVLTYSYEGDPSRNGGYWSFDGRSAAITRQGGGTNSRRINTETAWNLATTTSDGEVIKFSTSMRLDAYDSSNVFSTTSGETDVARGVPQVALDWRYPLANVGASSAQTITPIMVASATPYGGNSIKIPNEDSLDFELDDVNIFSPDPYMGYDHIFTGPRVAYGGEYNLTSRGMPAFDALVAQSYQAHADSNFIVGDGMDQNLSDIVGRLNVTPSQNFGVSYRYRLNKDDYVLRRSEITANVGPRPFNLQETYVFYDKLSANSPFNAREQMITTLSTQVSRYWSTQLYNTENLGYDAGPLQTGARLIYDDECFQFMIDGGTNNTAYITGVNGTYLMVHFVFKTLTQFPMSVM